jgi:predicted AAA+ superfamily ATPase
MKNYIVRDSYQQKIKKYIGKDIIKVLSGQRRVGKSYLLYQTMDSIKQLYPEANIIYVNLELNELEFLSTYQQLYDFAKSKYVDGRFNALMIDEIQEVPQFEKALKSLLAEGGLDIYCTGSNAHLLSGELTTYIGGRYIEIPVHALSYPEFLVFS